MTNNEKYDQAFTSVLDAKPEELNDEYVFGSHNWDSLGHMELVTALEEAFDIMLEPDDMTHFGSYENGKKILSKYGVTFE